jgi:hypothetical protein
VISVSEALAQDARASRWLRVTVEIEPVGRLRLLGRALRAEAVQIAWGWLGGIATVKSQCSVRILRRCDGDEVAAFDHDNDRDALDHASSLRDRLATMRLWDFCRAVGIPFDAVADATPVSDP